jgi:hypothetical protein
MVKIVEEGSILDDGYADGLKLTPEQKARQRAHQEKWRRANERRAAWSQVQFEQEEQRLRAEIENWGKRDAA